MIGKKNFDQMTALTLVFCAIFCLNCCWRPIALAVEIEEIKEEGDEQQQQKEQLHQVPAYDNAAVEERSKTTQQQQMPSSSGDAEQQSKRGRELITRPGAKRNESERRSNRTHRIERKVITITDAFVCVSALHSVLFPDAKENGSSSDKVEVTNGSASISKKRHQQKLSDGKGKNVGKAKGGKTQSSAAGVAASDKQKEPIERESLLERTNVALEKALSQIRPSIIEPNAREKAGIAEREAMAKAFEQNRKKFIEYIRLILLYLFDALGTHSTSSFDAQTSTNSTSHAKMIFPLVGAVKQASDRSLLCMLGRHLCTQLLANFALINIALKAEKTGQKMDTVAVIDTLRDFDHCARAAISSFCFLLITVLHYNRHILSDRNFLIKKGIQLVFNESVRHIILTYLERTTWYF